MTPLIVRIDIEQLLIDAAAAFLITQSRSVPVSDELASGQFTESVAIYRTGGTMNGLVLDNPTIVVEAKGKTKTSSSQLINLISAWIHSLIGYELGGYGICSVDEFSGPALLPSEDSPTRYTQTLSLGVQTATG